MSHKKSGIDELTFYDLIQQKALVPNEDAEIQLHLMVFYDKRHSWMRVPLSLIHMLGFKPRDFSRFTRIDKPNNFIYLDEDIDTAIFMNRLQEWPSDKHLATVSSDDITGQLILEGETLLEALHVRAVSDGEVSKIRDLKRNTEDQPLH